MDTTPPPSETLSSTSIGDSLNENIAEIGNKDAEMSQLVQDPSKCNNMNINKRARQNSGQRNTSATSNNVHRNTALSTFGIVGNNTCDVTVVEKSMIRDHRMSVSDSGESETPRPTEIDIETLSTPIIETAVLSGGTIVSEALESDGDVHTDDEVILIFI